MLTATAISTAIAALLCCSAFVTNALQVGPLGRREVLLQGGVALVVADTGVGSSASASSDDDLRQFQSRNSKQKQQIIDWSPPSEDFSKLRYSTSSLSDIGAVVPNVKCSTLPPLPNWMDGHWLCSYKFDGASFPQGRDKLSLTVPGAGLGTCAVLPNVGFNPTPFVQRFGFAHDDSVVVEDVAYNLPRKFEGFWPQAKVASIRVSTTGGSEEERQQPKRIMSPACLVTGEGCSQEENPLLHDKYATRCRMEFQGPTRRGGLRSQQLDLSMVDYATTTITSDDAAAAAVVAEDEFLMSRTFVQYNVEQELTCYYREFVSYFKQQQQKSPTGKVKGRTRVAAFLPSSPQAVAIYSYTMKYDAITSEKALLY